MEQYVLPGDPGVSEAPITKGNLEQEFWTRNSAPIPLRPIRLIQLLLDVMLISVTISLWMSSRNLMGTVASIILISLFAAFAIVMSIDTVGQFGGYLTPDFPMFLVSLVGFILFTAAAQMIFLLVYREVEDGSVIVLIAMCLFAALLFLIDAMIMTIYWRYTYAKKGKCLPCLVERNSTVFYEKPAHVTDSVPTLETKISKSCPIVRDDSTSVSRLNLRLTKSECMVSPEDYGIGVGKRRQYVDCATNTDSQTFMSLVNTQTEPIKPTESVDHGTSAVAPAEERHVQTYSQCPVCSNAMDYSPEGICPSFLALVQSLGVFSCPAGSNLPMRLETPVLVDRGTLPGSNRGFGVKSACVRIPKRPQRVYETRPCPTHGAGLLARRAGLPVPVTRVCLPDSIIKNKRSQTLRRRLTGITDKYQNTEDRTVEKTTTTENPSEPRSDGEISNEEIIGETFPEARKSFRENETETRDGTSIGSEEKNEPEIEKESLSDENVPLSPKGETSFERSSGEFVSPVEGSSENVKTDENIPTPTPFEASFSLPRSSEKVNLSHSDDIMKTVDSTESKTRREKSRNDKKISHQYRRKNRVDSITSTETSSIRLESSTLSTVINSDTPSAQMSSGYSNKSRESVSPNLQNQSCHCSQPHYYYKDVFGRDICGHCSHKYLIKIPQRRSVKPPGDVRCWSCSRDIMQQTPKCWKCRYQMYTGQRK